MTADNSFKINRRTILKMGVACVALTACKPIMPVETSQASTTASQTAGSTPSPSTKTPLPTITATTLSTPAPSPVVELAAGGQHSMALRKDGTVWTWGLNYSGQLGDGSFGADADKLKPIWISKLENIRQISAGGASSYAIGTDDMVWAWGSNTYGDIGDGTAIDRPFPAKVFALSGAMYIDAGLNHVLAVTRDGTVWYWGEDPLDHQQLSMPPKWSIPMLVSGLRNVVTVAAGGGHSVALKNDGTVWAWGSNEFEQLGDGTNIDHPDPVRVLKLENIVSIDAGQGTSLALKADGTIWQWGNIYESTATKVSGLAEIAMTLVGYYHQVALRSDGSVWTWGENNLGQLGYGTQDKDKHIIPAQVVGLPEIAIIAGGDDFTLALAIDGTLWGWGLNNSGQLGDGTTESRLLPVQIGEVGKLH